MKKVLATFLLVSTAMVVFAGGGDNWFPTTDDDWIKMTKHEFFNNEQKVRSGIEAVLIVTDRIARNNYISADVQQTAKDLSHHQGFWTNAWQNSEDKETIEMVQTLKLLHKKLREIEKGGKLTTAPDKPETVTKTVFRKDVDKIVIIKTLDCLGRIVSCDTSFGG